MAENKISIAIDGPSGAGKSTLARCAARRFGLQYVDTGAIYRAVALAARRAGIDPRDEKSVSKFLEGLQIELRYEDVVQKMYLGGEDVTPYLRAPEISAYASEISAMPQVRRFLLDMQRSAAEKHNVVMDGRDIGTVVLPDAQLKIFLTAAPEERAKRRCDELREDGCVVTVEEVLESMRARDENDESREASPLRAARDAIVLDTTGNSLEESEDAVCSLIAEKLGL